MPSVLEPPTLSTRPIALLMRIGDGFVPERAGGVRATVEWRVETPEGEERLWMRIEDGGFMLTRDALEPSLTMVLRGADLVRLVEGRVTATELFLTQRLTLTGDVLLAVRLPDFFGLTPPPELERRPGRKSPAAPPGS